MDFRSQCSTELKYDLFIYAQCIYLLKTSADTNSGRKCKFTGGASTLWDRARSSSREKMLEVQFKTDGTGFGCNSFKEHSGNDEGQDIAQGAA
jgi:hypothetical protein